MEETTTPITREEHFANEAKFRQEEVDGYQRNVDKYTIALQRMDELYPKGHELYEQMQSFKDELQQLILAEKYQQARSNLMLDACRVQIEQATARKITT